jgi:dTDP-4-dehydrorhamnose reductase
LGSFAHGFVAAIIPIYYNIIVPDAKKTIAILGAGQLGRALYAEYKDGRRSSCTLFKHSEVDITDIASLRKRLLPFRPNVIIHTAAMTKVNECERDPRRARLVNAGGTGNVVKVAEELGAHLVYTSTDFVFAGKLLGEYDENEAPEPLSVYGKTKLEGEQLVLEYDRGLVVRTAQVFAPVGRNFVNAIFATYDERKEVRVVDDEFATPTYAAHFATALAALLPLATDKVYHIRGPEEMTYFDFARRLFIFAGLPEFAVLPTTSKLLHLPASRPQRAVLAMGRYLSLGLPSLPPLDKAMQGYIERLKFARSAK